MYATKRFGKCGQRPALQGKMPTWRLNAYTQTGFETSQEKSLEDLRSRKKAIINHLQDEPTFLNSRPQIYRADSVEGGFDGLKTVIGRNQRKKEAMPKSVSDMFVATRSTRSLDMLSFPSEGLMSDQKEFIPPSSIPGCTVKLGGHTRLNVRQTSCPTTTSLTEVSTPCRQMNRLHNSLGSTFDISGNLLSSIASFVYNDTEFCCFPTDDDDETFIPLEHTVVSRFGPISRMARAKTNNCAPVQVTADSFKKMTPVLAVTPMERPMPIPMPVTSRFGSFGEKCPEPCVKPTPTEAPSVWQESPQPSQMNIALLKAGAAEAVSNNERLAYELQAVELEISLKTGREPEPVRKLIHEAVSCPWTHSNSSGMPNMSGYAGRGSLCQMMTTSTTMTMMAPQQSLSVRDGINMGHGHVTDCLATIEHGYNPVSSEMAAKDFMEEYQRSSKGHSVTSASWSHVG